MGIKNLQKKRGFVILFAVTLSAILLAIALGVANIALKEVKFTTNARNTNNAFFAADTGAECALFNDKLVGSSFPIEGPASSITCASTTIPVSFSGTIDSSGNPTTGTYNFSINSLGSLGASCAKINVFKDKRQSPMLVVITSKGYDTGGGVPGSCNPPSNSVERELKISSAVGIASPTLVASPSSISAGGVVTVTFGNVIPPSVTDRIGYYTPPENLDDHAFNSDWKYTSSCTKTAGLQGTEKSSGSCNFTMSNPGSYQFRLFANDGFTKLATSNTVTVTPSNYNIEYLVVAGGGGGGHGRAGGGGAGGMLTGSANVSPGVSTAITVGGGGAGSTVGSSKGVNGSNSSISSLVVSTGGGGGGSNSSHNGATGGSGGGASGSGGSIGGSGGTGIALQGNNGGCAANAGCTSATVNGAGGGGAGGVGTFGSTNPNPPGGVGLSSSISGSAVTYAKGGTGSNSGSGTNASANTGNGGNGGDIDGGAGGSGIVIIRYLGAKRGSGGTDGVCGSYYCHIFTSSGTFTP